MNPSIKISIVLFLLSYTSLSSQTSIYWGSTTNGTLQSSNLDGSNVMTVTTSPFIEDIVYNPLNDSLYYTDGSGFNIFRIATDGTGQVTLISGLNSVDGMELDLFAGKMYYAESGTNTISKANLDGSNIEIVANVGSGIEGIALDIVNQKIYYTLLSAGEIYSVDFDGNNTTLIYSGAAGPIKMAKDMSTGFIYFTEFLGNTLSRINADGTGYMVIVSGFNFPGGVVLDADSGLLYFGDNNGIYSVNIDGTGLTTLVMEPGTKLTVELNNNRSLPPAGIPTMGEWGLISLSLLMLIFGLIAYKKPCTELSEI